MPIPIANIEVTCITVIFTEVAAVITLLAGVTDMTNYSLAAYHGSLALATLLSGGLLYILLRNPTRFVLRWPSETKWSEPRRFVVLLMMLLAIEAYVGITFPISFDRFDAVHLPPTAESLYFLFGPADKSIGYASLYCWLEVSFILMATVLYRRL